MPDSHSKSKNLFSRKLADQIVPKLYVGVAHTKLLEQWLASLIRVFLTVFICFGGLWLADKINTAELALTRFSAKYYSPLSGYFYPITHRNRIVLVTYDDEFLKNEGLAWPISYQEHADRLSRLLNGGNVNFKPKGLFVDIYFGQERQATGLDSLGNLLCDLSVKRGIPVFLGGIPNKDGKLSVRNGFIEKQNDSRCFTITNLAFKPDPIDGIAWVYPLGADAMLSPALALAKVEQPSLVPDKPMALLWSSNTRGGLVMQDGRPSPSPANCEAPGFQYKKLLPALVTNLLGIKPAERLCPYHDTFSMSQISEMSEDEIGRLIDGRFVLLGAQISGYNDFAISPTHGLVAGLHVHAMALDNLLSYGAGYRIDEEWHFPLPDRNLFFVGLFTILAMIFASTLVEKIQMKFESFRNVARGKATTIKHRSGREISRLVFWLVRVSFMSTAALLMIITIQNTTRIGLLPLIELVSMTLMAEGIHITNRAETLLSTIFYGDTK
jgi:hypothetical protein